MDSNTINTNVLIIGGGPAGLSAAVHLANLFEEQQIKKRIMLIEKGKAIGSHTLSGAIVVPEVFKLLFKDRDFNEIPFDTKVVKDKIVLLSKKRKIKLSFPIPYMRNKGNYVASLSRLCQYMASVAEEKGVEIYSGFSVNEILYENGRVVGAKTIDTGVDGLGNPMLNFQEGTKILADVVVFAEGVRGTLTQALVRKFRLDENRNNQMFSLGCKELWSIPEGRIKAGKVYHTMGYPLMNEAFGGGFIYGLKNNKLALGLVVGLDYQDPTFDIHHAFQIWKTHPFIKKMIQGGKLLEYGAKTLPEGGYYAIPKLTVDNALIVGDAAGFLAMPALKGIHLAMYSAILAAQTIVEALVKNDFSETTLSAYERAIKNSVIYKEMYPVRNVRQAFADGLIAGGIQFAFQFITGGAGLRGRLYPKSDSETTKKLKNYKRKTFKERFKNQCDFDKEYTFDKATDVYYSGVHHDENQVPHLRVSDVAAFNEINIKEYGAPCQYFCPAEVYEIHTKKDGSQELRIHFENCVHCKTCDIKSVDNRISWHLPNGDNGPDYRYM